MDRSCYQEGDSVSKKALHWTPEGTRKRQIRGARAKAGRRKTAVEVLNC